MDTLVVSRNLHNNELCDYSGNMISKFIRYSDNRAQKHPEIIVSKKIDVQIKDNRY